MLSVRRESCDKLGLFMLDMTLSISIVEWPNAISHCSQTIAQDAGFCASLYGVALHS